MKSSGNKPTDIVGQAKSPESYKTNDIDGSPGDLEDPNNIFSPNRKANYEKEKETGQFRILKLKPAAHDSNTDEGDVSPLIDHNA
jgi:hypothetical protein